MKLSEFIDQAMTEIAEGIQRAKISTSDIWAIAPGSLNGERIFEKSKVEFDVAVTVVESTETQKEGKGGIAAKVEVIGISLRGNLAGGGHKVQETAKTVASRIAFKVPVYMNAHFRGDKNIAEEAAYFAARGKVGTAS